MGSLLKNIRFYVLLTTALTATSVSVWVKLTIPDGTAQIVKLTQFYALMSLAYLYFALLATPLTRAFPALPFRGQYIKARRAIGVSAFFFSLFHARSAFFDQLGGFSGLPFLPGNYLFAITLSSTALVILTLMALTSFDFMVAKLTFPRWKFLHRFVYLAAMLILIHALMLGTHFQNLSESIAKIFLGAFIFLLVLEAMRFYAFLRRKFMKRV